MSQLQASPSPPGFTLRQRNELPVIEINNAHARATIALQGAQLLEYTPHGQQPVIWLSEQAAYQRGQSVRGGIPICWPWFGALERNPEPVRAMTRGTDLPAHGLVRSLDWALRRIDQQHDHTQQDTTQQDTTAITFGHITDCRSQQHWPHCAELELEIRMGRSLRLQLTTRNLGAALITLTQALHTYFAVSDITAVEVTGLEQLRYIDTLDNWRETAQAGSVRFTDETDRIYCDVPERLVLHDSGWHRRIEIRTRHSSSAVVWNPWIGKSQRLSQFASDAWRGMVCIETANVLEDSVAIEPAAAASIALEITLL
ncbi:MAG: D-hexose-6-phosphate mutarotase [Spongiibacteraceae bacterium]|jgi:glucose-6-phosphate 1-epimerase|nr:D-hexose-6-phosphate mutarotase [Spongiibacteraceae bacterium]